MCGRLDELGRERGLRLRVAVRIERTPGESLFWTTGAIRTVQSLALLLFGLARVLGGTTAGILNQSHPGRHQKKKQSAFFLHSVSRCLLHHPANPWPGRGGWGHPERGPGAGLAGGGGAVVSAQMHRGAGSRGGTLAEVGRAGGVF